jgi:hypothetical protein
VAERHVAASSRNVRALAARRRARPLGADQVARTG